MSTTIRLGDSGPAVVLWQRVLGVSPDGDFGPTTDEATKAWQAQHGLAPDGIVGPATWKAAGIADGEQVPVTRTVVTLRDYTRAVLRGWSRVGVGRPSKAAIAVLWSQYRIETGGQNCWNWNIGNVKKVVGDGFNFMCLHSVWEGYPPAEAAKLVARGEARYDVGANGEPNADHAKAVGARMVSIVFDPPHRQTQFRAYASLEAAMGEHLELLAHRRYTTAWPFVLAGDFRAFANALKARGYFTAAASAYANGMAPAFNGATLVCAREPDADAMHAPYTDAMASCAYEDALAELEAEEERPTLPDLSEPPSEPTMVLDADQPIIHPDVPMGRFWEEV
jgi:hypothetical protein